MKTLDEVIEYLDNQDTRFEDALYYLKMYRLDKIRLNNIKFDATEFDEAKQRYIKAANDFQKAKTEMEEILGDHVALKQWWVEQENLPLSWEELKSMQGKPIWVEYEGYTPGWEIIKYIGIHKWTINSNDDEVIIETNKSILDEEEQGKTWQAYKKEKI